MSSRCVADGILRITRPGDYTIFVASKHNEYLSQKFLKNCGKDIRLHLGVHSITADNANAYFNGKKWVWTPKENNPRYNKAIKESTKYLNAAKKCIKKDKKYKIIKLKL